MKITSEEISQKIDCEVKTQINEFLRLKRSIKCPNLWLKIDPSQAQKLQVSKLEDRSSYKLLERKNRFHIKKKELEWPHWKLEDSEGGAF